MTEADRDSMLADSDGWIPHDPRDAPRSERAMVDLEKLFDLPSPTPEAAPVAKAGEAMKDLDALEHWFLTVPEAGTYAATTMLGLVKRVRAAFDSPTPTRSLEAVERAIMPILSNLWATAEQSSMQRRFTKADLLAELKFHAARIIDEFRAALATSEGEG